VYKSQYAANPFEQMNAEEIERYKWEVEHRGQGELAPVTGKIERYKWEVEHRGQGELAPVTGKIERYK